MTLWLIASMYGRLELVALDVVDVEVGVLDVLSEFFEVAFAISHQ